ncbi:MAG: toxin-activating lysine-acyltransferase [Rhodobacteraceae bacterium]|nr:toxin-activating lysine-acyltransferase [Paracoccaceae bacterium]
MTASPQTLFPAATPDAVLNQLVMRRIGERMAEPAFQEALRSGKTDLFVAEIKSLFAQEDFIRQAFPDASREQMADIGTRLNDTRLIESAINSGVQQVRHQQIDKQLLDVVKLAMRAHKYRTLFLSDLSWRILPPLMLGQSQFMVDAQGNVVAFITWAKLNAQVAARLDNPMTFRLQEADWNCGQQIRIIDVISPLGQEEALAKEMLEKLQSPQG